MRDRFLVLWRSGAQAAYTALAVALLAHGVTIPADWQAPVLSAAFGLGVGLWAWGTHWLQTRRGDSLWARLARGVGLVLVLGAVALPQYTDPPR
jgi:uncharacterized membrane protein YdfJ with MMPL/SSD domain